MKVIQAGKSVRHPSILPLSILGGVVGSNLAMALWAVLAGYVYTGGGGKIYIDEGTGFGVLALQFMIAGPSNFVLGAVCGAGLIMRFREPDRAARIWIICGSGVLVLVTLGVFQTARSAIAVWIYVLSLSITILWALALLLRGSIWFLRRARPTPVQHPPY